MSPVKVIIPLFIVLGFLQAVVLTLPFLYWRFAASLGTINRFLFASFLLFLAFVAHPLLIIALITFTIAPALLSIRHDITSRLSTAYCALIPESAPSLSSIPFLSNGNSNDTHSTPRTNREWLLAMVSGYLGWKTLGTLPSLMVLLVIISLWKGREAGGNGGWLVEDVRDANTKPMVGDKRVSTRSERTDVQVFG